MNRNHFTPPDLILNFYGAMTIDSQQHPATTGSAANFQWRRLHGFETTRTSGRARKWPQTLKFSSGVAG